MEKQDYLNIIAKEIKENKKKLEEINSLIEFYTNLNDNDRVKELENNKLLYEKRVELFSEIEKLPIYLQLKNCDTKDLKKYNEKIIFDLVEKLMITTNKITSKEMLIEELNKKINELYEQYKNTNDSKYEEEARIVLENIKTYKEHIEGLKNNEDDIRTLLNGLKEKKDSDILNNLMIKHGISSKDIEKALNTNLPNNIDKLAVPICNNLDILNFIKEYQDIYKSNTRISYNIQSASSFKKYKEDFLSTQKYIEEFLGNDDLYVYNVKDFNRLDNNIRVDLNKIHDSKALLEQYFNILNKFPKNIENYSLYDLKILTFNVLIEDQDNYKMKSIDRTNELAEELNKIEEKQRKLNKTKFKTNGVNKKLELLEYKHASLVQESLDILWKSITHDIYKIIENVKSDVVLLNNLEIMNDSETKELENKNIIETYRYSFLNLINLKKLVNEVTNIYNETIQGLMNILDINNAKKEEFNKLNTEKENKLQELEEKINSMYKKVSDLTLQVYDYDKILEVFKDNNIVNSIVKLERNELINNVKKHSFSINIIEDLIEENIESKESEEKPNLEENIIKENKSTIVDNNKIKEDNNEPKTNKENKKIINEKPEEKKETNKKIKITKEDLDKIKKYIIDLGIDYNTLKSLINSIITNDDLLDSIMNTSNIENSKKAKIKYTLKDINLDNYNNVSDLVVDLTVKYELDLNTLKQLGKDILKNRSVIFNIIKSNKKVLFNVLKSDVLKKILKK